MFLIKSIERMPGSPLKRPRLPRRRKRDAGTSILSHFGSVGHPASVISFNFRSAWLIRMPRSAVSQQPAARCGLAPRFAAGYSPSCM